VVRALVRIACGVLILLTAVPLAAQRESPLPFSPADADRFAGKLSAILQVGSQPPAPARAAVSTTVSEPEVNAYLRYKARDQLPAGVVDPAIQALGDGRLAGTATVDLDAVRGSRERSLFDPMRWLRGRVAVSAVGVLNARGGAARFDLESARVGGVPIPKSVLQELVSYYSRSASRPDGINLDAPFELPAGIRDITIAPGYAVIVQ
jgi:hypothetical protein